MRTLPLDTRPEAEKVLISLLRNANTAQKFAQVRSLSQTAIQLSRRAIARANPDLNEKQINLRFISLHYGKDLEQRVEKYLDVFIHKDEPYSLEALQRIRKDTFEDTANVEFYFSSPEDIIIHKLQGYKMGGLVSERQWLDVIGVIKVQGDLLDKNYLAGWSKKLSLFSLLKEAFDAADVKL